MLQKFIHAIARPRHPWRHMKFDELAEIYTSMSLRSFGFSMMGIFVPIYLYKNDVSIQNIFLFFGLTFLFRIPANFIAALVTGRIGPKHTIALSTLVNIIFLGMLLSFAAIRWPLAAMSLSFALATGLFFLAYNTDFSKIKDTKNGGKELGWLYIFERAGGALGPLIGGVVASFFAPEYTIALSLFLLTMSLIPLFMTNEPVRLHQHITFKGFHWRRHVRAGLSIAGLSTDIFASVALWSLFVGTTVFTEGTYAKLGTIVAASTALSMFSAYSFGKFIDRKSGFWLMCFGVIMNAGLHLLRPFISVGSGVVAVSMTNEPLTLAYRMPLVKGYYDEADSEEGYRIVYIAFVETFEAAARALLCFGLWTACYFYAEGSVLRWSFVVVSVASLGMLLQKFAVLKKS